MGESPEKTHISFESQSEDRSQKTEDGRQRSEDRSRKTEVGPQDTLRQRQRSVLCNPVLVRETRISQGEGYVPICVFPGQPRLVAPNSDTLYFSQGDAMFLGLPIRSRNCA